MNNMKKNNNINKYNPNITNIVDSVDTFIVTEQSLQGLPELSSVERNTFEHDIARSHLYHSSKIEGSSLNRERIEKAINA